MLKTHSLPPTVAWDNGGVVLIDQKRLPTHLKLVRLKSVKDVAEAIKGMTVRGAPAMGVTAAMGLALAAHHSRAESRDDLLKELDAAKEVIQKTRPTAVNLFWALEKVMNKAASTPGEAVDVRRVVIAEAQRMAEEDVRTNRQIGAYGAKLLSDGDTVLTHCNAGALATVAYGTALGVIRAAIEQGKRIRVLADETRPRLQGARLTAFELHTDGIPVTVITDNMVGSVMSRGLVSKAVVGADRVLATGHVINKIGTLTVAVTAHHFGIPFYAAAPLSTFDLHTPCDKVVIEERSEDEVTWINGIPITPEEVHALNPAFDVTPPELVTGIITEKSVVAAPYPKNIRKLFSDKGES